MPCRSDYMEPSVQERQQQQAAQLLVFVRNKLGKKIDKGLKEAADYPGASPKGDILMESLCSEIRAMSEGELDRIVYNGRDPVSRRLADWWDEHQAEDAKRREIEAGVLKTAKGAKAFFDKRMKPKGPVNLDEVFAEFSKAIGAYYDFEESAHIFPLSDGVVIFTGMNGIEIWEGNKL